MLYEAHLRGVIVEDSLEVIGRAMDEEVSDYGVVMVLTRFPEPRRVA